MASTINLSQSQKTTQTQKQTTRLTPRQVLEVRLLELGIEELRERVDLELNEGGALEEGKEEEFETDQEDTSSEDYLADSVLDDPENDTPETEDNSMMEYRGTSRVSAPTTFLDNLIAQASEVAQTERQKEVILNLVHNLDDDGLLRTELWKISDELAIYDDIDMSVEELEDGLKMIQEQFEPAGIGARTLQECLIIQIERKHNCPLKELMLKIIRNSFDDFTHIRWDKIKDRTGASEEDLASAREMLSHLNPRPGSGFNDTQSNYQTITPDFELEITDEGEFHLFLNNYNIPELKISESFVQTLEDYGKKKEHSKSEKDVYEYTKERVERANNFIEAMRSRRMTLWRVMTTILKLQKDYFLSNGDETLLKPMILEDVAKIAGVDLSTVSRTNRSKYIQTPFGVFPLKHFFTDSMKNSDGEEVSVALIKRTLKEIIDSEDKKKPYADEVLAAMLKEKGFTVARRTVAKYREQLGIPVARLRK